MSHLPFSAHVWRRWKGYDCEIDIEVREKVRTESENRKSMGFPIKSRSEQEKTFALVYFWLHHKFSMEMKVTRWQQRKGKTFNSRNAE